MSASRIFRTWPPKKARALIAAAAILVSGCGPTLNGDSAAFGAKSQVTGAELTTREQSDRENGPVQIADTFTSVTTPGTTAYKIGPLDVLDISVFKVPELSKSVQVAGTGVINLPLIGEITAAGRTAQEVERDIAARLGAKYLQKPQVTVYVKEYSSQRVTVEGAVKKPGVYPIKGKTSLLQFIAMAEGLDPNSDATVVVFRNNDGKRSAAKFDVSDIRKGQADDPDLQAGDVVVVGSSAMKETFNNFIKILPLAGVFAFL